MPEPTTPPVEPEADSTADAEPLPAPDIDAIAKERDQAKRELGTVRRELEKLREAAKAREDAEKTESQKLQERLTEMEKLTSEKEQQLRETTLRAAAQTEALRLGFLRPERAWREIDMDALEVGEDGTPQNLTKLLEQELKERPELKAQARTPDSGAGNRGKPTLTIEQIRRLSPEEYAQRRDEVHEALAAHRAGR